MTDNIIEATSNDQVDPTLFNNFELSAESLDDSIEVVQPDDTVIFNDPTTDDDEANCELGAAGEPIGQEVYDELFDNIEAIKEEI